MDVTEDTTSSLRLLDRGLTMFPVLAGAVLASLYVAGALVKTAQLKGADVAVRDVLPSVPLQQILGLGIGVGVQALPVVAVWVAPYLWGHWWDRKHGSDNWQPPEQFPVWLATAILVAIAVVPWTYGLILGLAIVAIRQPELHDLLPGTQQGRGLLVSILVGISAALLTFWVEPGRLPAVKVITDSGMVRGALLVTTDTAVHVLQSGDRYMIIPTDQVRSVRARSIKRDLPPTPSDLVADGIDRLIP